MGNTPHTIEWHTPTPPSSASCNGSGPAAIRASVIEYVRRHVFGVGNAGGILSAGHVNTRNRLATGMRFVIFSASVPMTKATN